MKFENTEVFNFEGALRAMRNPLDSWSKSDSSYCIDKEDCPSSCQECCPNKICNCFEIGDKDMKLAQTLVKAGSEHRKFLRQIMVSVDITAPRYIWSEFDTYKIGTVSNSCSTMHTLKNYPITLDMFAIDANSTEKVYWNTVINHLEDLRKKYNETKDYKWFRLLKQELPESFLQKRTITMNYEVIRNVYQRKSHRLIEWSIDFVEWVKSLPYAEELLLCE